MSARIPTPIRTASGCSRGWAFFATEEDARTYAEHIRAAGGRYNGGFYDGTLAGEIIRCADGEWMVTTP